MVNKPSELADLIQEDLLPLWLREEIKRNREHILQDLDQKGCVTLRGPEGDEVTIKATGSPKTASA